MGNYTMGEICVTSDGNTVRLCETASRFYIYKLKKPQPLIPSVMYQIADPQQLMADLQTIADSIADYDRAVMSLDFPTANMHRDGTITLP